MVTGRDSNKLPPALKRDLKPFNHWVHAGRIISFWGMVSLLFV